MAWTAALSKVLVKSCRFQFWVLGIHRSEAEDGTGVVVTGSSKSLWMDSQTGHQGVDQIEEFPACNWRIELVYKFFLTYMTDDQKMDMGP
jgi:hypothetical protein